MLKFLLIFTITGCGKLHHTPPAEPSTPKTDAIPLRAAYGARLADYVSKTADRHGWPSADDCDGTVWAGEACLGGVGVDILQAEYAPGEIHRRPIVAGECYPGGSETTVSRDDLVLYVDCAFHKGDAGALNRLLNFGQAKNWVMGEPASEERVFMGPNLQGITARAAYKLGSSRRSYADLPVIELAGLKDYQQHIEVNEILLSSEVAGGATGWELELMKVLVEGSPNDPLFQAALGVYTGEFDEAIRLLLDPTNPIPTYVRGNQAQLFADAWWLRAAKVVLDRFPNS